MSMDFLRLALHYSRIPPLTFVPSGFFVPHLGRQASLPKTILDREARKARTRQVNNSKYMSAFLVEKETIDRILMLIDIRRRKSRWFMEVLERELSIDFGDVIWQTQLGQKMLDLNELALGYRYGDEQLSLRYVFKSAPGLISEIQMFKSMQCWLYQCCEGDIPETSKLYKACREKIEGQIAVLIVSNSPEYEEADWA